MFNINTISNTTNNYAYPVGDFLSGFSEDDKNPCDYELECQRMVIRGVEFFDKHTELHSWIRTNKPNVFHAKLKPLIDYMCINPEAKEDEDIGQTGAMVGQAVKHAFQAKIMGLETYIKEITSNNDEHAE
jgi:hypothetical protein